MATIALVNPRRAKRRRSRRKMTAKQLKYFGRRKHKRRSRRVAVAATPRRRRRHHSRRTRSVARRARRHVRRFARHTGGGMSLRGMNFNSFLKGTLVPSAVGAAGALGVDLALGYLTPYLPATLTTAPFLPLTKIAAAVGLGMLAQGVTKDRNIGEHVMAGAITVVAYSYLKSLAQAQFPTLPLSEYVSGMGYAGPALAFPDAPPGSMGLYVGRSAGWNPSVNASRTGATTKRVGLAAVSSEFEEGGYTW